MNPSINESIHSLGQDSFKWWFGVVEEIATDGSPQSDLGQVRVRIIGYHTTDERVLPNKKLPWASVLQPTTNAAVNDHTQTSNGLRPGSFVVGFFIDGDDSQQPIVIGSLYSGLKVEGLLDNDSFTELGRQNIISDKATSPMNALTKTELGNRDQMSTVSNPSGKVSAPVADGQNGPEKTFISNMTNVITEFFYIFNNVTTYDYEAKLVKDITDTRQNITITSDNFPLTGVIQINNEQIAYSNKEDNRLVDVSRGFNNTTPAEHKKGAIVKHLDGEFNAGKLVSRITGKVIDIRKEINRVISIIRNLVSWLINTVKSYLLGLIGELLQSIVSSIKSAIPFNIQIIAEAILRIMNQIGCTFDISLLDSIMNNIQNAIENAINSILKNITDFIDKVNSCINDVFDNIMSITSLISGVVRLIEGVSKIFKGISTGDIIQDGKLNITKINSISNIVVILLKILGVGCGDKIENEFDFEWSDYSCYAPSKTICGDFRITKILKGLWNPIYPFNTVIRYGEQIFSEFDNTPSYERVLLGYPGGGRVEWFGNGNRRTTVNGSKVTVVQEDDKILIKGDCLINVEGNYHLRVSKDYHLEVDGNMFVYAANKSKFTFAGDHETHYKLNAELKSPHNIALVGTRISMGASFINMSAGVLSTYSNERNDISLGSMNQLTVYRNNLTGMNDFSITGSNDLRLIGGNKLDFTTLNTTVMNGSSYNQIIGAANNFVTAGSSNSFILGSNTQTVGGNDFQFYIGSSLKNVQGFNLKNISGINSESIQGVNLDLGYTLGLHISPLHVLQ